MLFIYHRGVLDLLLIFDVFCQSGADESSENVKHDVENEFWEEVGSRLVNDTSVSLITQENEI